MIIWTWRWKDDNGVRFVERFYDDGSKYVTEYHPDFVWDYRITKDGKRLAEIHTPKPVSYTHLPLPTSDLV